MRPAGIIENNNDGPFPRPHSSSAPPPPPCFLGCRVGCHGNDRCGFTEAEAAPWPLSPGRGLRGRPSCHDPAGTCLLTSNVTS